MMETTAKRERRLSRIPKKLDPGCACSRIQKIGRLDVELVEAFMRFCKAKLENPRMVVEGLLRKFMGEPPPPPVNFDALKLLHDFATPCCADEHYLETELRIVVRWDFVRNRWEASGVCAYCETDLTYLCRPLIPQPVGFVWPRPSSRASLSGRITDDGEILAWRSPRPKHPLLDGH